MNAKGKIIWISLGALLIPVVICAYILLTSTPAINEYRIMFEGVLLGGWIVLEIVVLMVISLYYSFAGAPPSPQRRTSSPAKGYDPAYARRQRQVASYYHLAAGLVLLIGGSICFGGIAITGL